MLRMTRSMLCYKRERRDHNSTGVPQGSMEAGDPDGGNATSLPRPECREYEVLEAFAVRWSHAYRSSGEHKSLCHWWRGSEVVSVRDQGNLAGTDGLRCWRWKRAVGFELSVDSPSQDSDTGSCCSTR